MLNDAYRPSFCHSRKCPCYLLPSDTPEASLCHFVKDVQGRERSFCNMTAHCPTLLFCEWRGFRRMSRMAGKFSLLSSPQAGPSPLRLPSFWVDKGLDMRSALYDQWGRPWIFLSFKICWNRVPPQDHHTSRKVVKIMNQSGWGFRGEVNTVWILNWHVVSPYSYLYLIVKLISSWLLVWLL